MYSTLNTFWGFCRFWTPPTAYSLYVMWAAVGRACLLQDTAVTQTDGPCMAVCRPQQRGKSVVCELPFGCCCSAVYSVQYSCAFSIRLCCCCCCSTLCWILYREAGTAAVICLTACRLPACLPSELMPHFRRQIEIMNEFTFLFPAVGATQVS